MQRIAIIGPCGAGKSTLATRLGRLTGLPVYHLDALYWRPGWVLSAHEEFVERQKEALRGDAWIVDGNFGSTFEVRMERADTVIFLDFPRWRYFPRIFRRIVRHYGRTRPDMGEGCPEKIDPEFIRYVWNFPRDSRPRILEMLDGYNDRFRLVVLCSPKDVRAFIRSVESTDVRSA